MKMFTFAYPDNKYGGGKEQCTVPCKELVLCIPSSALVPSHEAQKKTENGKAEEDPFWNLEGLIHCLFSLVSNVASLHVQSRPIEAQLSTAAGLRAR